MAAEKKIKLLFLIPTMQCGGSEKYMWLLCNTIDTAIFEVTLVVLDNSNPFYTITNTAVKIIDLHTARSRNAIFKIRRVVQQQKPEIIYSVSNHLNVLLAMFKWLLPAGIKMMARESSLVSSNVQHAAYPAIYRQLVKKFYNRFDRIVCQSVAMQQDLVAHFNVDAGKTVVMYNPVEATTTERPAVNRAPYKLVTVARLSKEKGIERLIKSVAALRVPYQYFIIGDGPQRQELEALVRQLNAANNIFFTGQQVQPYAGMEDAALFLMGSYYEGFPNVLLEAGARGIPAVAFEVPGGISEIIIPGENGVLVKQETETAFTAAIEKALQLPFNSAAIQQMTNSRFSPAKAILAIEALFKAL